MKQVQLCVDCEVYPALVNSSLCFQCKYGAGRSVDGEKELTKTEKAHVALSKLVANGHCSGVEAQSAWDEYKNRPKTPFFGRRKVEQETPEEKRARLEAIAQMVRAKYPENFPNREA